MAKILAKGRRGPKRRTPEEKLADHTHILELRLAGLPNREILERVNARRRALVAQRCAIEGVPSAEAQAQVDGAGITTSALCQDIKAILAALEKGSREAGKLLLVERIMAIEVELRQIDLIELRAWGGFDSCSRVDEHTTEELVEDFRGRKKMRVTERKKTRRGTAEPGARYLETALRCVELRAQLGAQVFGLAARLGMSSIRPEAVEELRTGSIDSLEKLLDGELTALYRAEARLLEDDGGAERRIGHLKDLLKQKRAGLALPPSGATRAGFKGVWELELKQIGGSFSVEDGASV